MFQDEIQLPSSWFFLILVILLLATLNKQLFFVVYTLSVPYLLFYVAYIPSGKIRKFNEVGDYSYGIYIYAFPIQQSIAAIIPNVSVPTMILLSFAITFVLAYFSWHIVEKRFLRMKNNYIVVEKAFRNALQSLPFSPAK